LSILDANINTAMDTSFCTNHYNVIIMLHNLWSIVVWIFDVILYHVAWLLSIIPVHFVIKDIHLLKLSTVYLL